MEIKKFYRLNLISIIKILEIIFPNLFYGEENKNKSSQKKKKWPNGGRFKNNCRLPIFLVKINAVQNEHLEAIIGLIFYWKK